MDGSRLKFYLDPPFSCSGRIRQPLHDPQPDARGDAAPGGGLVMEQLPAVTADA